MNDIARQLGVTKAALFQKYLVSVIGQEKFTSRGYKSFLGQLLESRKDHNRILYISDR